ncbi:cytochrome c oxidase assembly protein [Wenxinia saemankumensis]|uniref:Putative membrane protein n=1 Tax=Wenxinia saemankumensis TaxID=1447782 RepID=A0A1M6B137_9RHOB|nr:cytochrome c oxidase assembly protein [Wenxinia saemankumensis]SHI42464.1 putative membrane protein [Wenxinia saemankumensis]
MQGWILEGTYCGAAPVPGELLWSWNFDPALLVALAALTLATRGSRAIWAVPVLFLAFVSPLCALSSALFAARTVHHVLLVAVAAPLLATRWPARAGTGAALPFLVSTALLWGWHVPAAYDLALSDTAVYWAMQLSLLGSATWFWRAVLSARAAPDAVLWSLAGLMQMGFLGALLTFAPAALYAAHALAPYQWGLTPLGDQQLGGLIMWVPAALPYLAMIALAARRGWQGATPA